LHFFDVSVIFYAIYKNQEINLTFGVQLLQQGPWKESWFCNEALGAAGRRGSGQIPAGPVAGPVGEGPGRV
jgi:hypothetical protein